MASRVRCFLRTFRLSLTRHTLRLDYQSDLSSVEEYARTLLAEFEVLALSGSEVEGPQKRQRVRRTADPNSPNTSEPKTRPTPSPPKAPLLKPPAPKPPGSAKACNNWLSAHGCKYGARCNFHHDMESETLQGRCFYCSSPEHWANSCSIKNAHKSEDRTQALQTGAETPKDPKDPKAKPKMRPGGKGAGKLKQLEAEGAAPTPPVAKVAAAASKAPEGNSAVEGGGNAVLGPSHAQLVQEATEVLRSLRLKKISEVGGGSHKVRQISLSEGYGATSALRQGSAEEICLATPVEVQVAVGSASMHVNPLLTERKLQPILPMAALPRLGCVIQWSDVGFSVKHPVLGLLPTRLNGTSPELPARLLLKLITEYEGLITREDREREGKQRLWNVLVKITPDVVNPQLWLEHHIREGTVDETVLHVWVRSAFQELPERIASRIACAPAFASERVPFNRAPAADCLIATFQHCSVCSLGFNIGLSGLYKFFMLTY